MTVFSISAAARATGVDRTTIYRAIKSGRLSATTTATGERGIDLAELLRVFGPLPQVPQDETVALPHSATPEHTADATLIKVLQEQLQQANEREQQAREREVRLLALLETAQQVLQAEQQARRELETKLLPAPRPAPTGKVRVWALVGLLAVVVAFAGWHWRDRIVAVLAP
jgi:transcriptional regulator of acetoin/glycerol metabolism